MADLDLAYLPATELVHRIREKELSPVEAVENALGRIEDVQPQLNAFCFTFPEEALELARAAERAIMADEPLGPLHGVPIAIKDFTPTKGKTTTRGSYAFEHWIPDFDPVIVQRLRAAGAIMVGKTTTPEFAASSSTESPLWGITRNPWSTSRSPGGSSGGSAAAVATGCVALAEGTDMGGSVRIPAAYCGVVGLKPSLGRIPMDILPTVFDNISHFGPLARTVADAALFLAVTNGPDECDIQSLTPALEVPVPPPDDVRGLRLALSIDLSFFEVDPEIEAAVRGAAAALAERGAVVEEVELGWTPAIVGAWMADWGVYLAAAFADTLETHGEQLNPHVARLMENGLALDAVTAKRHEYLRTEQWHALARVFESHDALLCPTMALPPPEVGQDDAEFNREAKGHRYRGLDMTLPFNYVAQCPALSVPAGTHADGMPIGLQIVGHRFDDNGVLRIGAAVEAAEPWAGRRPQV